MSRIAPGDPLPDLTLRDQAGEAVRLRDLPGRSLVIFFYPKDDTTLCTREACAFRDSGAAFAEADATVVGISGDDVGSHRDFAAKYGLPYRLLADPSGEARRTFGVRSGFMADRVTFVFDAERRLSWVHEARFSGRGHARAALAAVREGR